MMTATILKKLIQKSLLQLKGDWVIIGGTVLPLVQAEYRSTMDIDMLSVDDPSNESMLALMNLASQLNLPVESINSAGMFFLSRIPDWKKRLVVHAENKKCRILRPNLDLFLELKLARFSESDESDIIAYLKWHKKNKQDYNSKQCQRLIKSVIRKQQPDNHHKRLQELLNLF